MIRTTRRISILRRAGSGGPLGDKSLSIKVDGKHSSMTCDAGYRVTFVSRDKKKHTYTVFHNGSPMNMETSFTIPAGSQDVTLEVYWTGNQYVLKETPSRNLIIRRDASAPNLYLRVNVSDVPLHLLETSLKAGDYTAYLIDTLDNFVELTAHGFKDGASRTVTVPAGNSDCEYLVTVNKNKELVVKQKKTPETTDTYQEKNFLPGGLSDV